MSEMPRYAVILLLLAGCAQQGSRVTPAVDPSDDPLGLEIIEGDTEAIQKSHSEKNAYRGAYDSPESYEAWAEDERGGRAYGGLNSKLHEKLRDALREHFRDVPPSSGYTGNADAKERYAAFTFQFWDWFAPNCQVGVRVDPDRVSRDLLARMQSLLVGEFAEWCIIVVPATPKKIDGSPQILVFAKSIKVPSGYLAQHPKIQLAAPATRAAK